MLTAVTLAGGYNLTVAAEKNNKINYSVKCLGFYSINSVVKEDYRSSKSFVCLAVFCTAYCV